MAKPFSEWTVLPHGKLTHLDDNMLTVTGILNMRRWVKSSGA